ncbi:MAG: alanine--tRNA ligase [Synergistaceae bacterium]|nr:alanine--tRNA ligase [Synergistaceae bacterium]
MKKRTARELRELFIKFWEEKGSKHYPSFSLIPDDPSLLFTIAGMVPLKPYYLGIKEPEAERVVTSQKCVRTNDIENVGRTARHHTFFEMLGNFTWGSYFKKEAISWAWEFLTERVGLEPERLYATIYKDDDEAFNEWSKFLSPDRIYRCDQDENYWFMGDTGPCGPCSEIYYDRGEKFGCGKDTCGVGCDCDRYLEIWNLVFTQFDRQKDGSMPELPHKNIDTGMGLERLAMVVQGVETDYETDLFTPLINYTCKKACIEYGKGGRNDMAVRVIADHVRAVAFMLADGVLPSNDGPGYVLRRLLRRAVRFGKLLGFENNFLCEYMPILIEIMGDVYKELITQRAVIEQIINIEEERFNKTLQQGTELFEQEAASLKAQNKTEIPGEVIFTLYDTFGFPPELTQEMAEEKNLTLDEAGFKEAMNKQRERARASSKQKHSVLAGDVYNELENEFGSTRFTGYTQKSGNAKILAILTAQDGRVDEINNLSEFELILDETPFYAERGGEVGDTGIILVNNKALKVLNTVPHGGIISHSVKCEELNLNLKVNDEVKCEVDDERRRAIRRNHTATHLLHEALGQVLGRHVRQAGSLVTDMFLRFDFTHHSPMTDEEIAKVELIVNKEILNNVKLEISEHSKEEAQALGAKALFDEKYGDVVRVVNVPEFSMELCGGLHVNATGDIGSFKILKEESIGSGARRILATTGLNVLEILQKLSGLKNTMLSLFSADEDNLKDKAQNLIDELKRVKSEVQAAKLKEFTENSERFLERRELESSSGNKLLLQIGRFPDVKPDMLREIGDKAKARPEATAVVLASLSEDKSCKLIVMADDRAVKMGVNAGALVKEASGLLGGKGGGRPSTAQGGGRDGDKLDEAIIKIEELIKLSLK